MEGWIHDDPVDGALGRELAADVNPVAMEGGEVREVEFTHFDGAGIDVVEPELLNAVSGLKDFS